MKAFVRLFLCVAFLAALCALLVSCVGKQPAGEPEPEDVIVPEKPGAGGMAAIFECERCGQPFARTTWGQTTCDACLSAEQTAETAGQKP